MKERIKRYFKDVVKNIDYEKKYEQELKKNDILKEEKKQLKLEIKELEKKLERGYMNNRIISLEKKLKEKDIHLQYLKDKNQKLSEDNIKLIWKGSKK